MGLFISALMQRTQGATVVTFFTVLFLTLGTMFGVLFWNTMAGVNSNSGFLTGSSGVGPIKGRAPEFFLWFNPFAAQYDVICGASDGSGGWCNRLNTITNGAISSSGTGTNGGIFPSTPVPEPGLGLGGGTGDVTILAHNGGLGSNPGFGGKVDVGIGQFGATDPQPFGVRRDTFWPRSLRAWGVTSVLFILASIQLVSPTRRWRILRRPFRRKG
jgi:hypothetical protein